MDEWVVWFYVEPFTLHLSLSSNVLVPVPVPIPVLDTVSVNYTIRQNHVAISELLYDVASGIHGYVTLAIGLVSMAFGDTWWRRSGDRLSSFWLLCLTGIGSDLSNERLFGSRSPTDKAFGRPLFKAETKNIGQFWTLITGRPNGWNLFSFWKCCYKFQKKCWFYVDSRGASGIWTVLTFGANEFDWTTLFRDIINAAAGAEAPEAVFTMRRQIDGVWSVLTSSIRRVAASVVAQYIVISITSVGWIDTARTTIYKQNHTHVNNEFGFKDHQVFFGKKILVIPH